MVQDTRRSTQVQNESRRDTVSAAVSSTEKELCQLYVTWLKARGEAPSGGLSELMRTMPLNDIIEAGRRVLASISGGESVPAASHNRDATIPSDPATK
jgi:hypothetical protein